MNVPPAAHNGAQAQTSKYVFLGCGEELRWAEPPHTPSAPLHKKMRSTVETLGYRVGHKHEAKKAKLPKGFIAPLGCLGHLLHLCHGPMRPTLPAP